MKNYALYTYFNDNYFECGSNMIYSFVSTNSWFVEDKNPIIILQDDKFCVLNDDNRKKLLKIYPRIVFNIVNMDDYSTIFKTYNWFKTKNDWVYNHDNDGINRGDDAISAFYKYEIFKKTDIKHKVLLDADIIVRSNIKPLFETNTYFSCFPHESTTKTTKRNSGSQYFNGGVYCVNDDFKTEISFEKIIEYSNTITKDELIKNPVCNCNGKAVDQDYLNLYFCDYEIDLLPSSVYNCLVSNDLSNAAIIHYYGPYNKPWQQIGLSIQRNRLGFLIYYEVTYWKNRFLSEH